jgi:hypothetical protein
MSDPQIVGTLRRKADEIEAYIIATEQALDKARADLAHIRATMWLMDPQNAVQGHMGVTRVFRRGEIFKTLQPILEAAPDGMDTRELAEALMIAKGLNPSDKVFRKNLTLSIVHILRMREKRGAIIGNEKRRGVRVWRHKVIR